MKLRRKLTRQPRPFISRLRVGMRLVPNHRDRNAPPLEVRMIDVPNRNVLVAAFGRDKGGVMRVISEHTLNGYTTPKHSPWGAR